MQVIELLGHYKLIFLFVFCSNLNLAQSLTDDFLENQIKKGINYIVIQNYDLAEKTFQDIDTKYVELPLGKIYLAATLIAKSYDYETPFEDEKITSYLSEAKKVSENLLKVNKTDILFNYYYALAIGYQAYFEALKGNVLKAFSLGLNSYDIFEDILKKDSSFQDAMIAVGTYKYWKSDKLKYLNWLPFIEDEREIAKRLLINAIKNNSFNSHLAIYSLIWIFINERDFIRAKNIAELALKKYPQSRLFREVLARVYEDIDLNQSINLYYKLLDSYQNLNLNNRVKVIIIKHKIAIQLQKLGKDQQALKICDEILSIQDLSNYELEKLESRLERIKRMKIELSK
jgi:hypothetical protein